MIIICILIIILIKNNSLVFEGATTGLMLWFHNVIPLLLPFMLLSRLLVSNIYRKEHSGKNAILLTILPGLLCGYPIGAYIIKNCLDNNLYSKRTAAILLPLCNNASPMFITGFIVQKSLCSIISVPVVFAILYLPYIVYVLISTIYCPKSKNDFYYPIEKHFPKNEAASAFDIQELIYSINTIGVYIILCSVAAELLLAANGKLFAIGYTTANQNALINILLSSIEITRGVELITGFDFFNQQKITALILALTSFGGISSILQTRQVIQNSGLSIKKYILVKLICGCASYFLALLMI
jgi:hypothetical protein